MERLVTHKSEYYSEKNLPSHVPTCSEIPSDKGTTSILFNKSTPHDNSVQIVLPCHKDNLTHTTSKTLCFLSNLMPLHLYISVSTTI